MKKLEILISALSVMTLMCFINLSNALAACLLTGSAANFSTQIFRIDTEDSRTKNVHNQFFNNGIAISQDIPATAISMIYIDSTVMKY